MAIVTWYLKKNNNLKSKDIRLIMVLKQAWFCISCSTENVVQSAKILQLRHSWTECEPA